MVSATGGTDYTYGAVDKAGNAVVNMPNPPYNITFTNDIVMNIIMDRDLGSNQDHQRNPRHHTTFNAKPSAGTIPGIDRDGILRDPWGNPYIITIDMNDDNECENGFYGVIRQPVVVWSFGPDEKFVNDPNQKKRGANADNVVSWE